MFQLIETEEKIVRVRLNPILPSGVLTDSVLSFHAFCIDSGAVCHLGSTART